MEAMSGYFRSLKRRLDCPRPLRQSFLSKTKQAAEEFMRGKPNATLQEVIDFLGEPEELARGFLETIDQEVLERYRRRKKFVRLSCIAVLIVALVSVAIWSVFLYKQPVTMEIAETLTIYPEVTEGVS